MQITPCIIALEIKVNLMGSPSTIYPTLLRDERQVILVDAGFPGQAELFRAAVAAAGADWARLDTILLTHHDLDHIGGLPGIRAAAVEPVAVMAHEDEAPYISGEKTPLKLAGLEARLAELPPERLNVYERMKAGFAASFTAVDRTLYDGEELPVCGGMTVIATPGHTLGHLCLYHPLSKTLIAGDMLRVEDGALTAAPPDLNADAGLYAASMRKLAAYDIETVICYHGGVYRGDANARIRGLAG